MAEFLAMGGYAAYVWPALGLTAAVMIGLAWHAWRRLRQEERAAAELERSRSAGSEVCWRRGQGGGDCGLNGGAWRSCRSASCCSAWRSRWC